jgi:hypothetical protein
MALDRKTGGRQKGTRNRATLEREARAAHAAMELAKAVRAPGQREVRVALHEMQKALVLVEGVCSKLQPPLPPEGVFYDPTPKEWQRLKAFKEWMEFWHTIQSSIAKYQAAPIRAVDAPTPPPSPGEMEQQNTKVITLRVFEGGVQVKGPGMEENE